MELNQTTIPLSTPPINTFCNVCHQVVPNAYYFCPNCGAKTHEVPLSTSAGTQTWIYIFSIILPMMFFLFVTRWPGIKYFKSKDAKAHRIGQIAWALLILATIATVVYTYIWTEEIIQSQIQSINTDFGDL